MGVGQEELRRISGVLVRRVREFSERRPMSAAEYGTAWGIRFDSQHGDLRVEFEAHTPEGALYLSELATAGFFDGVVASAIV